MEVKVIRLVSGEEIITFISKKTDDGYQLDNPCFIVPTENGVGLMELMPYTKISENGVFIKTESIVFMTEAVPGLEDQYKKVNSKIDLPPEKKIII